MRVSRVFNSKDHLVVTSRGNSLRRQLDLFLGSPILFALGHLRTKRRRPELLQKIGIITCSAIGDSILASAIARDLKCAFPGLRITAFISTSSRHLTDVLDGF